MDNFEFTEGVMKAWARITKKLLRLKCLVWIQMAAATKMGIMDRATYQATLEAEAGPARRVPKSQPFVLTPAPSRVLPNGDLNMPAPQPTKREKEMAASSSATTPPSTCLHGNIIRYGNAAGKLARCSDCNSRWRWSAADNAWKSDGSFSKSSQPPQQASAALFFLAFSIFLVGLASGRRTHSIRGLPPSRP